MFIDSRMVKFLAELTEGKEALIHVEDNNNVEVVFTEVSKTFRINGASRDGLFYIDNGSDCHAKVSFMTVKRWVEANV